MMKRDTQWKYKLVFALWPEKQTQGQEILMAYTFNAR
jgi:hypothetical protein